MFVVGIAPRNRPAVYVLLLSDSIEELDMEFVKTRELASRLCFEEAHDVAWAMKQMGLPAFVQPA